MACGCENTQVQEIPIDKGISLDDLYRLVNDFGDAAVHFYVVSTVCTEQRAGREYFIQKGSAPNFSGQRFTLCTCKHDLRTVHKSEEWPGYWVAGFSGVSGRADEKQYLLYLMRVGHAYKTHRELWDALDAESRRLKNAATNKLGDVFEPVLTDANIDPRHYRPPIVGHVHSDESSWMSDIYFKRRNGKSAALLVGDEKFSYCWATPCLYIKSGDLGIGRQRYARKKSLANFIDMLKL